MSSFALLSNGKIKSWGGGNFGVLGNNSTNFTLTPIFVSNIEDAVDISAKNYFSCALIRGGTIKCWGLNSSGQLGNGLTADSAIPVNVNGIQDALQVSVGGAHTCAVREFGEVVCWGFGGDGQLGDGSRISSLTPVQVVGINDAVSVSAGEHHTCALLESNFIKCWGRNTDGQLGNGTTSRSTVPVISQVFAADAPSGVDSSTALIVSAGDRHTCGLTESALFGANLLCWGDGGAGQLGSGLSQDFRTPVSVRVIASAPPETPLEDIFLQDVNHVSAGRSHSCAVQEEGYVWCWGSNVSGRLGVGDSTLRTTATRVVGITNAMSVSAGGFHTCAVLEDNSIWCWGAGGAGRLGNGSVADSNVPIRVSGF